MKKLDILLLLIVLIIGSSSYSVYKQDQTTKSKQTKEKRLFEEIEKARQGSQLTAEEINHISKTIVYVECSFENNQVQSGSGVLSEFKDTTGEVKYLVRTNAHVIFNTVPNPKNPPKINCTVSLPHIGTAEKIGFESIILN